MTFEQFINEEFSLLKTVEVNDTTIFALKRRIIKDLQMMLDERKFESILQSICDNREDYLEERRKLLADPENQY